MRSTPVVAKAGAKSGSETPDAAPRPRRATPAPRPDRQHNHSLGYLGGCAFLGIILLGFLIFTYPVGSQGMGTGSPIYQISLLACFGLTVWSVEPWSEPRRLLILPLGFVILLGWCWLSVSWAISPESAIRRVVQATIIPLAAFYVLSSLRYFRFMSLLRFACAIQLALCYLAVFLVPEIGIQQAVVLTDAGDTGAWSGIMMDKNTAGAFCAVVVIIFLFDAQQVRPWIRAIMITAATVFLIKSASKTAIGIEVLAVLFAAIVSLYNPVYRVLLIPLTLVAGAMLILWQDWILMPFSDAIYEPLSFTGRGMVWAGLWAYIEDHWFFGTGFGSFWSIGPESPINRYSDYEWVRSHVFVGHNGYLDLWATIGLPGLLLSVMALLIFPLVRTFASKTIPRGRAAVAAGIIVFCAGNNLTESSLMNGDHFLNVFIMFAAAMLYIKDRPGDRASQSPRESLPPILAALYRTPPRGQPRAADAGAP